jgi:hypothetical protein
MALSQLNNCIKSIKKLCDFHSVIFQAHINQHLPFLDSNTRFLKNIKFIIIIIFRVPKLCVIKNLAFFLPTKQM